LTEALHVLQLQLSPSVGSSLAPTKLTQVHLEKRPLKRRVRGLAVDLSRNRIKRRLRRLKLVKSSAPDGLCIHHIWCMIWQTSNVKFLSGLCSNRINDGAILRAVVKPSNLCK